MTGPATTRETLIVLPIVDGLADTTVAHLAAKTRRIPCSIPGRAFVSQPMPATVLHWEAVCGVKGDVYALGGVLAGLPICPDCEAA